MTEFFEWQLAWYKQRYLETTDPIAKAFLRKQYYELSKSNPDETTSIFCGFTYSGTLPIGHYAENAERGERTF